MAAAPDYSSILRSPSFTFLVGPGHTKLTVQSRIAKHVSQPLDELMNNGQTRESRHHIAVLEEEDVETFIGFCEFAYTGDYTTPSQRSAETKDTGRDQTIGCTKSPSVDGVPPPAPTPPVNFDVGHSSEFMEEALDEEPFADENQPFEAAEDGHEKDRTPKKKGKKDKGEKGKSSKSMNDGNGTLTPPSTPPLAAEAQVADMPLERTKEDGVTGNTGNSTRATDTFNSTSPEATNLELSNQATNNQPSQTQCHDLAPSLRSGRVALWDDFVSLQYKGYERHHVSSLPSPIRGSVSEHSASTVPYLCFHAKLYTFASRYLVPTLAQLSLAKLHQDLVRFPLTSTHNAGGDPKALAVLELLQYTYINTTRSDPVFHHTGDHENRLRKLVVHYAACKARELAAYYPTDTACVFGPLEKKKRYQPTINLRELLDSLGELASDLVHRMM